MLTIDQLTIEEQNSCILAIAMGGMGLKVAGDPETFQFLLDSGANKDSLDRIVAAATKVLEGTEDVTPSVEELFRDLVIGAINRA